MGRKGPISLNAAFNRKRDQFLADEPVAPKNLTADGKREWKRVTDLLRVRNALDGLDQSALHDYIRCWERLRECEAEISAHGVLVEGVNGRGRVKNPACQLARQYRDGMLAWCRELGLTLASRTRLDVQSDSVADEAQRIEQALSTPRRRAGEPLA